MESKSHLPTRRKPAAYAVFALIAGPLSVMMINRTMGLFMLFVPLLFCLLVVYAFLGGNFSELAEHAQNFIPWIGAYWLLCAYTAYKCTERYNREVMRIRESFQTERSGVKQKQKA